MFETLRCNCCGRFISDKDYNSGKLKSETIWNWDKTEIEYTAYYCFKCEPPKRELNEKADS